MPFTDPEKYGKRRFSPRIVIYPLVLLLAVWFMNKQQKIIQAAKEQRNEKPLQKMAVIPVTDSGELKPAGIGNPSAEAKPFLLLVNQGELDEQTWVAELRESRKEQCNIVLMNVKEDMGALEFFKLDKTPAAILRIGSYEIGRLTGDFGLAEINAFLDEKLKKDE